MSRRRRSKSEELERDFLVVASRRSACAETLAGLDAQLVEMQAEIRRLENGAGDDAPVKGAHGERRDRVDVLREVQLAVLPDVVEPSEDPGELAEARGDDWRAKAQRMSALFIGVCREATRVDENYPKLVLEVAMIAADVPGARSMRELGKHYGYTAERVSQRVEELQRRFKLPRNQHNKSAEAVASYKAIAGLNKGIA